MNATDRIEIREAELREVANVQPGYLSRGRVRSAPDGTHRLLQARDVPGEAGMRLDDAIQFHPERKPGLYQVSRGDVLVVARGQDHRAHHIVDDLTDTLASSSFYILRLRANLALPGYLAWWLNLPRVQAEIGAGSRGTSIGYISRQTLEHLIISIPALAVQRRIESVVTLWCKKKLLQSRIDMKREQYIQSVCRQAVRRAKE